MHKILTINPGSTSTKIGIFFDEALIEEISLRHSPEELDKYKTVDEQYAFRKQLVEDALQNGGYDLAEFSAISCRGGIIKAIPSGTYLVDENVLYDSRHSNANHPSNLAALIGYDLAQEYGLIAYITDPPSTFEGTDIASISGNPLFTRLQRFHALNHKATAQKHCELQHVDYTNQNLIIAHIGGGISVGIHHNGRVIDVNDAMEEGPLSPERSGSLPVFQLVEMCFSGKYSKEQMRHFLRGEAGLKAYTGTSNVQELAERAKSDDDIKLLLDAFTYQIAKEIGAMATVVSGKVDAIILTGGVSYNENIVQMIQERVSWIGPIFVYPGEEELQALNKGVLNILNNKSTAKTY